MMKRGRTLVLVSCEEQEAALQYSQADFLVLPLDYDIFLGFDDGTSVHDDRFANYMALATVAVTAKPEGSSHIVFLGAPQKKLLFPYLQAAQCLLGGYLDLQSVFAYSAIATSADNQKGPFDVTLFEIQRDGLTVLASWKDLPRKLTCSQILAVVRGRVMESRS